MKSKLIATLAVVTVAAILWPGSPARAGNIDLATVPPRDSVQLTIYNSEDLTLARETRNLTLKKGSNRVQYSWAGTLIDPTSVMIRPLEHDSEVEILETTFPGDKPQQLVWNIESEIEGQVPFLVTYFTSGLSWSADYVVITDPDETEMAIDGYVHVHNNSGEEYEGAQVRLVVGVVNLVEKIRDLAQRQGMSPPPRGSPEYEGLKRRSMRTVLAAEMADGQAGYGNGRVAAKPAEIVKEGLSEYFIYTIEGTQSVPNGWSKRMISFQARKVDFDVLYRLRPHQYGPRPVRFYMLTNDAEHKLGTTPLPNGVVRTFRENGRDGLSFLGQQTVKYVPIKEDIELKVGLDDEVVHEHKIDDVERMNFAFSNAPNPQVIGWDERLHRREEIRNYRDDAIRMEVRHVIPGDIEMEADRATLHDYRTVQFVVDVKPHDTLEWEYWYVQHLGQNKSQDRIRLEEKFED